MNIYNKPIVFFLQSTEANETVKRRHDTHSNIAMSRRSIEVNKFQLKENNATVAKSINAIN